MKVSLGPDVILCGWLGLKHQLTKLDQDSGIYLVLCACTGIIELTRLCVQGGCVVCLGHWLCDFVPYNC